jgi:hypothetical protein
LGAAWACTWLGLQASTRAPAINPASHGAPELCLMGDFLPEEPLRHLFR